MNQAENHLLVYQKSSGYKGNEKADELAKKGAKLRAELMLNAGGEGWLARTVKRYWEVRGR